MPDPASIDRPACPSPDDLRAWLAGDTPDDIHQAVLDHVDQCAPCQHRLDGVLDTPDPFFRDLHGRAAGPDPPSDAAEWEPLLPRLKALHGSVVVAAGDETPAADPLPLPRRIGAYEVVRKIGAGGMGTVYLARHEQLKRDVAIKVLTAGGRIDPARIARFRREMEAVGRLDHPHIVRATDAGEADGLHYLVMEYVRGVTLHELVRTRGHLPPADACEIVRQAADGLHHAHTLNLVHRDIKPSNLMLADRGPTVKILDLGLARLLDDAPGESRLTASVHIVGTPDYLAPERWESSLAGDIRSDIYGLGCTLFFLLAGRAPFEDPSHSSVASKMRAHLAEPRPDIRLVRREVSDELAAVLHKALARSPDDRQATPAELACELAPYCGGAALEELAPTADGRVPLVGDTPSGAPDACTLPAPSNSSGTAASLAAPPAATRRMSVWIGAATASLLLAAVLFVALRYRASVQWRAGDPPVTVSEFHVTHYRPDPDGGRQTRSGFVQQQIQPVLLRDEVRIEARWSEPAWCYLLALNPDGSVQRCYGPGDDPPQPCRGIGYPAAPDTFFQLNDGRGQQVFVLLLSRRPWPAWGKWDVRDALEAGWTTVGDEGVWAFDGRQLSQVFPEDERPRGDVVGRTSVTLKNLCTRLAESPAVDVVRAIGFRVH